MREPAKVSSLKGRAADIAKQHPLLFRLSLWASSLVVIFTLLLLLAPVLVAHVAEGWLQENGAADARINDIDINPFTGKVRIYGLDASSSDNSLFIVESAELDFRWWPLASRRAYVQGLQLSGVRLDIVRDEQSVWHMGGVILAPAAAAAEEESEQEDGLALWGIGSEFIRLADVQVRYADGLVDTTIDINEIRLGRQFSWNAALDTDFSVDMSVNEAPLLVTSTVAPWDESRRFAGELDLQDFSLSRHGALLEALGGIRDITGTLDLRLQIGASITNEGILEIQVDGPLGLDAVSFTQGTLDLANGSLDWDGSIALRLPASSTAPLLQLDGNLRLQDTQVNTLANRAIDWQGKLSLGLAPDGGNQLEIDGSVELGETGLVTESLAFSSQSARWEGTIVATQPGNGVPDHVSAEGSLQIAGTAANLPALELAATLEDFAWTGTLGFSTAGQTGDPAVTLQSGLVVQGLGVAHAQLPFGLLNVARVEVADIDLINMSQAGISQLTVQDLRLLASSQNATGGDDGVLTLGEFVASDIALESENTLQIGRVQVIEPAVRLVRNADGEFDRISQALAAFSSELAAGADADVVESEPSNPFRVVVTALESNADNLLYFQDQSVSPAVSFRLDTLSLQATTIDTAGSMATDLTLALDNAGMSLAASGSVNAFAAESAADLQLTLSRLDLPPLSSYIPGYNIERGRVSSDTTVKLSGESLDVRNAFLVEGLTMTGKAAEGSQFMAEGMELPLDVALDLLRDANDDIRLDIPVTGSLSDPEFGTADIVRVVMQNALQNAAFSYVKNALQPLGTILMVANLAQKVSQPMFEPIGMLPGESSLTPADRQYLFKLADLLEQRPRLRLSICSVAAPADRNAMVALAISAQEAAGPGTEPSAAAEPEPVVVSDQQQLELAAARTAAVTNFLTTEAGVDRARLFICRDTLAAQADAVPRVTIAL